MNFQWQLPTHIIFGTGRFDSVHKHVRGFGKRALVVTSNSFKNGDRKPVLDDLLAQLKKINVEVEVFSEIEPNPRTETIDRAAESARSFKPRYIIALGGGSVMDAAKCIALLAINSGGIFEYSYRGVGTEMKPFNHALPIVCIPTIAATSSETDFFAVVTDKKSKMKTTVFGSPLQPTLSIIDPQLTYSVGKTQTINGAFDTITHVMESYLSTKEPRPFQDHLTEAVVETVVWALRETLENPKSELGRANLSWCSAFALSGALAGREGGWPIHALEHGISAILDQSHGKGLAMILPRVMAWDQKIIGAKIERFNQKIFGAKNLENGLVKFMREIDAWTNLSDLMPKQVPLDTLLDHAITHAFQIKAIWKKGEEPYLDNIRPVFKPDARRILEACNLDALSIET